MATGREVERIMSLAAGVLTAAAVLLAPTVHFLLSYERVAGSLDAEAELTSRDIAAVVTANPDLWRYEQVRLSEYLSRRPHAGQRERRRLLDAGGVLIAEDADPLPRPLITRSLPLLDAGTRVGTIEISRSLRPHVFRSLAFALALLPVGILALIGLHTVPLRAIRASQAALRRERDTAQKYLDVAGVAFVILDGEGRVSLVNRRGAEILGLPEARVVGQTWLDAFVDPADRPRVASRLASAVPGEVLALEYGVLSGSGRRIVSWFVTPLERESGAPAALLGSGIDVTEQRLLEERLRESQKLEAVGLLAAGVAHDFNNILSAIKGSASAVRSELPLADAHCVDIDEILDATERAAAITRSLLAFGRRQSIEPHAIDVADVLRRSVPLLRALVREEVHLEIALPPAPLPVIADPLQVEQVIVNLVANARDATPAGGRITVAASRIELDGEGARAAGVGAPGPYARVAVADSGSGLGEEARPHVFEPFYTTKEVGKGAGLGLAVAYGIVAQHRGSISVASEPGRGATFAFLLPLAADATPLALDAEDAAPTGGRRAGDAA